MNFSLHQCLLAGLLAAAVLPVFAFAQTSPDTSPPSLEQLEESDAPTSTEPGKSGSWQIIEKRERGRITSVEVKSGNSSYYLRGDNDLNATPADRPNSQVQVPQWRLFEFDLKRPAESQAPGMPASGIPAPPAQP